MILKTYGHGVVALGLSLTLGAFGTGCASKKFVRQEVQTSATKLSARLDTQETSIQSNTNQITELVSLNKQHSEKIEQNSQRIETVKTQVDQVDGKATDAHQAADHAGQTADKATTRVVNLEDRFSNRNHYNLLSEKTILFKLNNWKLSKAEEADLDDVARVLKENPDAVAVLEGRTDSTGNADYNFQLGQRRLDSVARYLVVDKEVPAYRIYKMSYGSDRPVADNHTRDGRTKNRCTLIEIYTSQTASKEMASR